MQLVIIIKIRVRTTWTSPVKCFCFFFFPFNFGSKDCLKYLASCVRQHSLLGLQQKKIPTTVQAGKNHFQRLLCLVINLYFRPVNYNQQTLIVLAVRYHALSSSAPVLCMRRVYSPEMQDYIYDLIIMTSLFQQNELTKQNVRNSMSSHKSSY